MELGVLSLCMLAKRQVSLHVGKETSLFACGQRDKSLCMWAKRQVRVDRGGRWMEERNILMEEDLLLTALP
jgi:hypothetical protein